MDRRRVLRLVGATTVGAIAARLPGFSRPGGEGADGRDEDEAISGETPGETSGATRGEPQGEIELFLCGDVMTGRGIDQILPHPGDPRLHERVVHDATRYVQLAEEVNGRIDRPVDFGYIWGDALEELKRAQPDARIINLETAVTGSDDWWEGKGINYRMHPDNVACLTAAGIDCCAVANNHVLDWGYKGLAQTLETLEQAGLKAVGAGRDRADAERAAILDVPGKGRVVLFSFGTTCSGIPRQWAATGERAGVALIESLSRPAVEGIAAQVRSIRRRGDVVVVSLHWGGNWGYDIPDEQRAFAHALIDEAAVDVVHGHSSHHPRAIEVHRERLILYGCGDFINDYEGIAGHEEFRSELGLMYFPTVDAATGRLLQLKLVPTCVRRFQVRRAGPDDARWLLRTLNRVGAPLGTEIIAGTRDFSLRISPARRDR